MTTVEASPSRPAQETGRRSTWALWASLSGVFGILTNLFTQPRVLDEDRVQGAERVVELLGRVGYHIAAVTGVVAGISLLVFAAAFQRWAQRQGSDSLALRIVPLALTASAGAMLLAYTVKGQLAVYLDGGINENTYQTDALYTYFLLDDLSGFGAWWGVVVMAGAIAWLSFRDRLVVRWVGALGVLAVLAPAGFLLVTGLTGFPGVIGPVWLTLAGIGMALRRE